MDENKNKSIPIFKQPISRTQKLIGFIKCVAQAVGDANIPMASKAVTYYLLLSLFPAFIIVGNLIPLLRLDRPTVVSYIEFILPENLHEYFIPVIEKVITSSNTGILSAGIVVALWAISRGLNTAQLSMNQAYGLDINSLFANQTFLNYIIRRALAFIMTFFLIVIAVVVIIAFTFGQIFLNWLISLIELQALQTVLDEFMRWKWPLAIVIIFLIVFALFYFLPNVHLKLHYILLGSIIATTGMLALSQIFSYYLKYFGSAWDNYGTIGAIIIFLLWINMSVTIFLFGNAVNVGFAEASQGPYLRKNTGRLSTYLKLHEINKG
ncbi:YihY/virulence factor BrkB family protein [Companilactobacillus allii]|uniref:Ribonuclease n=1 Tax=Companilactobacillus allii TaxID=1847728 RepID=A0A1P8Q2R6_9LACO|nr:YihY/virulence factor BrkB family protein [Companilactobacillus allii]APX72163.1 ribonuclease [Companilactobacillus allii]USQ69260.1 YihY/virulence factor BrkB family protein [Companilactobacillus allii]